MPLAWVKTRPASAARSVKIALPPAAPAVAAGVVAAAGAAPPPGSGVAASRCAASSRARGTAKSNELRFTTVSRGIGQPGLHPRNYNKGLDGLAPQLRQWVRGSSQHPSRPGSRRRLLLAGLPPGEVLAQLVAQRLRPAVVRRQLQQRVALRRRLGEPALLGEGVGEVEARLLEVGAQARRHLQFRDAVAARATLGQQRAELQPGKRVPRLDLDRTPVARLGGGGVAQALQGLAKAEPCSDVPRVRGSGLAEVFGGLAKGAAPLLQRPERGRDAVRVAVLGRCQLRDQRAGKAD